MPKIPLSALIAAMSSVASVPTQPDLPASNSATAFSRLSETAQNLIVNSVLGLPTPTDIPDSVKDEIREWVNTDETPPIS
jgi:hypothetical protein